MKSLFHSSGAINRWLSHRRWKIFVFCVPALLAAVTALAVMGLLLSRPTFALQLRYEGLTKKALHQHKFELARVASLRGVKVAKNERDRARWIFYLALALQGQGQHAETAALIADAAPLEPLGAGCMEAHLAVAESLLNSTNLLDREVVRRAMANPTNKLAVSLHLAERHLLSAVAIEPESLEANELLGRFYINTRQPEKARERLMKIYAAKPDTALLLAVNSDLEDDPASAVRWAKQALAAYQHNLLQTAPRYAYEDRLGLLQASVIYQKYMEAKPLKPLQKKAAMVVTNAAPEDSPGVWMTIARLLVINGKYGSALETLNQRMLVSSNSEYRPAIAELCAVLAQNISPDSVGGGLSRLQYLQQGLTNDPNRLQLQLLLMESAHATNTAGRMAKQALDQWVASSKGETAAEWQFVLWTDFHLHGDLVTARQHLQTAHDLAPKNPLINNDLAMLDLVSTKASDWTNGLAVIQSVVDQNPYEPGYRDTRGQLLAKLGRNREALEDLEFAVRRIKHPAETRRVLAKVDAALGIVPHEIPSDQFAEVRKALSGNDYAAALKTLEQGMLVNTNPAYATAIADICVTWVENLPLSQHAERLRLIERGLNHNPLNPKLQALLLEATRVGGDSGTAATRFLDQLVANTAGESAAQWHLILGREAREKGDLATARRQLEAAEKLDPQMTQTQLELARVLAAGNQADLSRGLQLIDSVADKYPDSAENADFRSARGRILAGLGRNQEAVNDLSFAAPRLANPTDSAEAHRILAKVYDALGKHQMAEQQRRLLENN